MLTLAILVPLAGAALLMMASGLGLRAARWTAVAFAAVPLLLLVILHLLALLLLLILSHSPTVLFSPALLL